MTRTYVEDEPMGELGAVLGWYADVALRPDAGAMDRIRAELRAEAQRLSIRRHAEALAAAMAPSLPAITPRAPFATWSLRRVGLAIAASLVLGVSVGTTTFAASKAGGPLYGARIWLEEVTLPSDVEARLEAEIARAHVRLAEASDAAAQGDTNAVTAALAAYERIVEETLASGVAGTPGGDRAAVAFGNHLEILRSLLARVPDQARGAISHAIEQGDRAKTRLETAPPRANPQPGKPAPSARPARTPRPDPTANPGGPPAARPTPGPGAPAASQPTPNPNASAPGEGGDPSNDQGGPPDEQGPPDDQGDQQGTTGVGQGR